MKHLECPYKLSNFSWAPSTVLEFNQFPVEIFFEFWLFLCVYVLLRGSPLSENEWLSEKLFTLKNLIGPAKWLKWWSVK
jgi:hypothetical protein